MPLVTEIDVCVEKIEARLSESQLLRRDDDVRAKVAHFEALESTNEDLHVSFVAELSQRLKDGAELDAPAHLRADDAVLLSEGSGRWVVGAAYADWIRMLLALGYWSDSQDRKMFVVSSTLLTKGSGANLLDRSTVREANRSNLFLHAVGIDVALTQARRYRADRLVVPCGSADILKEYRAWGFEHHGDNAFLDLRQSDSSRTLEALWTVYFSLGVKGLLTKNIPTEADQIR